MKRLIGIAFLITAACCGCRDRPAAPATTSKQRPAAVRPPEPATSKPAPVAVENQDQRGSTATTEDRPGEYVSFPSAGVKLIRPAGFDDARKFNGFEQLSSQASIMVTRSPGTYAETIGFADKLGSAGMVLNSKAPVVIDGNSGLLLDVNGAGFAKWILVFGHQQETIMVTATFPDSAEAAALSGKLKAAVLSTRLDALARTDTVPDVGFTIVPSNKLKYAKRSAGIGKMLLYSKDGIIPSKLPEDPIFVAAPSLSQVEISDEKQYAEERIQQTASIKNLSITSSQAITIDGLHGYEIVAAGQNYKSAIPMQVYFVILYDKGGYIVLQGLARASESDEYLPEFKAMARSLTRRPK